MAKTGTKQNSFKVAVTGGIGSGKTAVCEILKKHGQFVVSCDGIYAELLREKEFLRDMANNFEGVISPDGTLDKTKLSAIVFSDTRQLEKLNSLTHTKIMERAFALCEGKKIAFCEVPLLFENGFETLFDAVIVVLRKKEDRISSVEKRSGLSEKEVLLRINSQYNYEKGDFANYYVTHNTGTFEDLERETTAILKKILNKIE